MKTLVVFYSRTGNTRRVAEEIQNNLDCDIEEIIDTKNRSGPLGYMKSGRDASSGKLTVLEDITHDPSQYDLLIIGTPLWAWHVATPVRTYIHQNHTIFSKVAFFCTAGGKSFDGAFKDMKELSGLAPIETLGIREKEIKDESYKTQVAEFVKNIQ
jgi:flavodoxin